MMIGWIWISMKMIRKPVNDTWHCNCPCTFSLDFNIKTYVTISHIFLGHSDARKRNTIDLTGDIWEEDFDNDDDDWYLEYNFLDDKPKQTKPHGSSESLDHALHEQFLDINTNLVPKPTSSSCQNKNQNKPSHISNSGRKQNAVNRYPENQRQVRPSPSYQPMTNAKCDSFHTPDTTQYKSCSFLSKQAVANHDTSSTKQLPKPSLYKPDQYKSSTSRLSNNTRPSTDVRPPHSPLKRSNFTWSTNQSLPKPSGTKPLSAKIRLHGDFVTAADVANTSCQETSVYKNSISSNGFGIVKQSSSKYSGPKKEIYGLKYKLAAQKQQSLLQSQYFNSDAYSKERNNTDTHLVSSDGNISSTTEDVLSPARQPSHEARDRNMHQFSPEYETSPEYGIHTRSDAKSLTSVEDTAVTRSFHKPRYGNILQETSTNVKQHKECEISCVEAGSAKNTWGNPVVSKRCVAF